MTDRVQQLVRSLRQRFGADADPDEVAAFLAAEGCDGRQIGEVVARWRGGPAHREAHDPPPGSISEAPVPAGHVPAPLRVLGPHEWGRFTTEAWGRLVALQGTGVLSLADFERIMEHALEQGEGRVTLFELDAILDAVGLAPAVRAGGDDSVTIH